jgi:hypothetical protein
MPKSILEDLVKDYSDADLLHEFHRIREEYRKKQEEASLVGQALVTLAKERIKRGL